MRVIKRWSLGLRPCLSKVLKELKELKESKGQRGAPSSLHLPSSCLPPNHTVHLPILALQFEPSLESILEYHHISPGWRTDSSNESPPSTARPDQYLVYKWFSDLDESSSTSWYSQLSSSIALLHPERATMPAYMVNERTSISTSVEHRSPPIRLSRSMLRLRPHQSSRFSQPSSPTALDKSYDRTVPSRGGYGLFPMPRRDPSPDLPPSSDESWEALPQCDSWDDRATSARSSRSSNHGALPPTPEVLPGGPIGGYGDSSTGRRLSGLRYSKSRIFRRG